VEWNTAALASGSYTLTATAADNAGLTSTATITVTVTAAGGNDTTAPAVAFTAPADGAAVSGTVPLTATASDASGIASVQFRVNGAALGSPVTAAPYTVEWNTAALASGSYTLTATAADNAGLTSTATITVTVDNAVSTAPVITGVSAGAVTSTSASISWTTDRPSDSQVAYGTTPSYGLLSALDTALVTTRTITLTGLNPSTTYNFQVRSRDSQGNSSASANFTFTTAVAGMQTVLLIAGEPAEVSGVTNGSVVTPTVAPAGMTGTVVRNGSGSVNFAPGANGSGVYFQNCCTNTNNAYYKFTGSQIGNIFGVSQGRISFSLRSRYSWAQRQANPSMMRYAFDVRDDTAHRAYFLTQISSGRLMFTWAAGGVSQFYAVPQGTEDTLFGNGVVLNVAITWGNGTTSLILNNEVARTSAWSPPTMNWTAASVFDLGAYEYLSAGGYYISDDVVDEFTVSLPPSLLDTVPPVVSITSPTNAATVTGSVPLTASASDNTSVARVRFLVNGVQTGPDLTSAPYTTNWNTAAVANGSYTISAVATDGAGLTATATATVTVDNPVTPPVITGLSVVSVTATTARIVWSTDKPADTQAAWGTTSDYGSLTALDGSLVTSHAVTITGLSPSTQYQFRVMSRDVQGTLTTSENSTFTTAAIPAGPQPVLLISGERSELSGTTNGATVTPSVAPAGFTGTLIRSGTGAVNFVSAASGEGVYFQNCCVNTNVAYYKFTGAAVGNVFSTSSGRVSFTVRSRYSFQQRQSTATQARYVFDVRDGNGHQFYFLTQISSGRLNFTYMAGGSTPQFYYVPAGQEETLFGNGVDLKVELVWKTGSLELYLNNTLVKTSAYAPATMNWSSSSLFNLGAYEYLNVGGYNASDDIIDEFTVVQ
jgi:hypothetical protein